MRYNWRYDSVLLNIYNASRSQKGLEVFLNISCCPNQLTITGDDQKVDFPIVKGYMMLLLEVTFEFEANTKKNEKL